VATDGTESFGFVGMSLRGARQPHGPANASPRLLNQQGGSRRSTVSVRHSLNRQHGHLHAAGMESIRIGSLHSEASPTAMRHLRLASMARRHILRNDMAL